MSIFTQNLTQPPLRRKKYILKYRFDEKPVLLNTIKPIFDNIFLLAYGGPFQFLGQNADTQNPFFEDFDPISGLYIHKIIHFHSNYNYKCPS